MPIVDIENHLEHADNWIERSEKIEAALCSAFINSFLELKDLSKCKSEESGKGGREKNIFSWPLIEDSKEKTVWVFNTQTISFSSLKTEYLKQKQSIKPRMYFQSIFWDTSEAILNLTTFWPLQTQKATSNDTKWHIATQEDCCMRLLIPMFIGVYEI